MFKKTGPNILFSLLFFVVSLASADNIRFLKTGPESLSARLKTIKEAKKMISVMSYEFEPCDSSTKLMIEALVERAQAGVSVQVIVDNYPFSKKLTKAQQQGLTAYMRDNQIDFRVYNDPVIILEKNHRNHIKFLITDPMLKSGQYIIGGRNLTDSYFGFDSKLNFRDQDFLITGASVKKAQEAYDTVLSKGKIKDPTAAASAKPFISSCLARSKRDAQVEKNFAKQSIVDALPVYSCSSISVVADNPAFQDTGLSSHQDRGEQKEEFINDARLKRKKATKQVLDFISSSTRLVSENQFYIPSYKLKSAFKKLRDSKEEKEVIVFTNSTGDAEELTDAMTSVMVKAAHKDTAGNQVIAPISGRGVFNDNNALTPKSSTWRIHTKSMVRNSKDVLMSSFNFDPRSYHTNLESSVVVTGCPSLAKAVETRILELKKVFATDQKSCDSCKEEIDLDFGDHLNGILLGNFF